MTTKLEKCADRLNDEFTARLRGTFMAKFNRELDTYFDILGSMALVSRPADGEPFTPEQKAWVDTFDDGYGQAMTIVREMARKGQS